MPPTDADPPADQEIPVYMLPDGTILASTDAHGKPMTTFNGMPVGAGPTAKSSSCRPAGPAISQVRSGRDFRGRSSTPPDLHRAHSSAGSDCGVGWSPRVKRHHRDAGRRGIGSVMIRSAHFGSLV